VDSVWTVAGFASSLGVEKVVSEALLGDGAAVPAGGEFAFFRSLASHTGEIEAKLRTGRLIELVARVLSKGAEKLKTAQAATGAELNQKFAAQAYKGEMGFGGTAEFYGGVCVCAPKTSVHTHTHATRARTTHELARTAATLWPGPCCTLPREFCPVCVFAPPCGPVAHRP